MFSGVLGQVAQAAWIQEISSSVPDGYDAANDVVVDSAGDVIAGGIMSGPGNGYSFAVMKFDGTTGAELWRNVTPGSSDPDLGVRVVRLDASDNVVVAGERDLFFTVAKLDGATGAEIWTTQLDGTQSTFRTAQNARAMVLDASGDVVAAGYLNNEGFTRDLFVAKFDGTTGAELWRLEADGGEGRADEAFDVAVSTTGDVAVAGKLETALTSDDFVVLKVDGASGAEQWRNVLDGSETATGRDAAFAVAFDAAGAVFAGGRIDDVVTHEDYAVFKFDGSTGAELWSRILDGTLGGETSDEEVKDLIVDSAGHVIVVGELENLTNVQDITVIKFDGSTGADIWRTEIDGNDAVAFDASYDVELDADENVIVAGRVENVPVPVFEFTVAKIDGLTGVKIWQQEIDGTNTRSAPGMEEALAIAVDAAGDIVAAGYVDNRGTKEDFTVTKLDGATGILGPVFGSKLVFKDLAGKPERRKIRVGMRDWTLRIPAGGSPEDPTVAGAEFTLVNPLTLESETWTLPGGPNWRSVSNGTQGYVYRDKAGDNGPCNNLRIRPGGSVKLVCLGKKAPIVFGLDEPTQETLIISMRLGGTAPQCSKFGGTVTKDVGISNPGPRGQFKAARATIPFGEACP
ncbi:MAG: hypothetical protein ACI8TX_002329 [Hyphomicrobiaceae bacterium]|jgi:hypothetical protein